MSQGLNQASELLLYRVGEAWAETVGGIRRGDFPLWKGLQNFLMFLAHCLEANGERSDADQILADILRFAPPEEGGKLSELEAASLSVLERKWTALAEEMRAGALPPLLGLRIFLTRVGEYLRSAFGAKRVSRAEKRRLLFEEFYVSRGFEIRIPWPQVTDDQLQSWSREEREIFYRPAEIEVPTAKLAVALGLQGGWLLGEEAKRMIGWERAEQGYWFLAEAQEECPRAGQKSYQGFADSLQPRQMIISLEEYIIFWYVGGTEGVIPDTETHTMLRTRYGGRAVLHAFGHVSGTAYEFLARSWEPLTICQPKMGVRLVETVPSA